MIDDDGRDVRFNPDGTKMFVLGRGSDKVYEFSLTQALMSQPPLLLIILA